MNNERIKAIKLVIIAGDYTIYISVFLFTKYPIKIFIGILKSSLDVKSTPLETVSLTG